MTAIPPRKVLADPELVLVDLRPLPERHAGMGFPPGSLSVPWRPGERYADQVRAAIGERTPVLLCLSGARARRCAELLPGTWPYLEGGVLAWAAEGLPLCGREPPAASEPPLSLPEVPRHLAACFVGELAVTALDRPELDPLALLRRCFDRAGASMADPSLEDVLRVLDQAALASLELGTPPPRVAANVDHMLARLPSPGWSRVA